MFAGYIFVGQKSGDKAKGEKGGRALGRSLWWRVRAQPRRLSSSVKIFSHFLSERVLTMAHSTFKELQIPKGEKEDSFWENEHTHKTFCPQKKKRPHFKTKHEEDTGGRTRSKKDDQQQQQRREEEEEEEEDRQSSRGGRGKSLFGRLFWSSLWSSSLSSSPVVIIIIIIIGDAHKTVRKIPSE